MEPRADGDSGPAPGAGRRRGIFSTGGRVLMLFALAILLVIGGVAGVLYITIGSIPGQIVAGAAGLAERFARDFRDSLGVTPQVKINQLTVIEETHNILELATVEKELMAEYDWEHTQMGSTKKLKLRGVFEAKGGYDLHDGLSIDVDPEKMVARVSTSAPRVLSFEQKRIDILQDENGWWNALSKEDRQAALTELTKQARQNLEERGFLAEAQASLEKQIREVAAKTDPKLKVEFLPPRVATTPAAKN